MATGGVTLTEDDLSCEICFNLYSDPKALKCLHTFCGGCISQLASNRRTIECPNCREKTNMADVRKDFRIQKLLDQHLWQVTVDDHATVGYSVVRKIVPADNNEMRGLSVIKNYKYVQIKSLATNNSSFSVIRIKIIHDNLYCACGLAGIKVYNKNCDLIKSITHDSFGCVSGMAEYGTGELILSCSETRNIGTEAKTSTPITEFKHHHRRGGLHHMTLEGMYLGPVTKGHFTDVSTYNDIVYGLTVREIQLFQIKTNKWVNVGKIDLNTDYEGYKFGINNEGIYLSTLFLTAYNQIYVYNHEAENTREIVVKPHPQWEPIVCSVDRHSNLLVVDKRSKTVYVYFHDESLWQEVLSVETCSEHEILTDAVVDETGDNIWVATYEKLIKYTRKSEK